MPAPLMNQSFSFEIVDLSAVAVRLRGPCCGAERCRSVPWCDDIAAASVLYKREGIWQTNMFSLRMGEGGLYDNNDTKVCVVESQ